jgi:hypothetical protein
VAPARFTGDYILTKLSRVYRCGGVEQAWLMTHGVWGPMKGPFAPFEDPWDLSRPTA